jgi:hypothetical protein
MITAHLMAYRASPDSVEGECVADKDTLEARRWFRQRLADLARQYPQLTTPAAQERLAEELDHQAEEHPDHGTHTHRQTEGPTEGDRQIRGARGTADGQNP